MILCHLVGFVERFYSAVNKVRVNLRVCAERKTTRNDIYNRAFMPYPLCFRFYFYCCGNFAFFSADEHKTVTNVVKFCLLNAAKRQQACCVFEGAEKDVPVFDDYYFIVLP